MVPTCLQFIIRNYFLVICAHEISVGSLSTLICSGFTLVQNTVEMGRENNDQRPMCTCSVTCVFNNMINLALIKFA